MVIDWMPAPPDAGVTVMVKVVGWPAIGVVGETVMLAVGAAVT
jgi:hypothetical protein